MRTHSANSNRACIAAALSIPGMIRVENLSATRKFYSYDPISTSPQPVPTHTATRKRNVCDAFLSNEFFPAGERARHAGIYLPSESIDTVDEVPDTAWYTNRHAARPVSVAELKAGPGSSYSPAPGAWTMVAAKNGGVTPGSRLEDPAGRRYLIKFDPLSNPELAGTAGVDEALAEAPCGAGKGYRAMASLLITGKPVGSFQYNGDDPNDLTAHEHRRDLRAFRIFCAWLGHDDLKALNSLDSLTEEDGVPFARPYLIDFGASLGSASFMGHSLRDGNVYLFDGKSSAAQFLTPGRYVPRWRHATYAAIPVAGRFEYEVFDPAHWVGDYPNIAFRNENPTDRARAASAKCLLAESEPCDGPAIPVRTRNAADRKYLAGVERRFAAGRRK